MTDCTVYRHTDGAYCTRKAGHEPLTDGRNHVFGGDR